MERIAWWAGLVCIFLTIFVSVYLNGLMPPQVPLFYSKAWGEEQLAHPRTIAFFLLGVGVAYCFNTWLINKAVKVDRFLTKVMVWSGVLLIALSIITVLRIWLIFL